MDAALSNLETSAPAAALSAAELPWRVAERARPAAAGSLALPTWLGRACICWLCACTPLVLAGKAGLPALRLALPAAALALAVVAVAEEARRERRQAFGTLPRSVWTAAAVLGAASALRLWLPSLLPQRALLLEEAVALAAAATLWELLVRRGAVGSRLVVVVGEAAAAAGVASALEQRPTPYVVAGVVGDAAGSSPAAPTLGAVDDLPAILGRMRPDLVVVASPERPRLLDRVAAAARPETVVAGLPEFYEHAFGRLPLRELPPSWFASALHLYRQPYGRASKRLFDLVVASSALVVLAPLLLLIALLVRSSRGPALYRQTREGEGGRPFTILKFRTMVVDAEADGRAVWAGARDPRVTRVGRVLRRLRLDELPQLWNVLEGTMSIVGPRPERPEHSVALAETVPFWSRRMLLKPGITGWAQVNDGYAFDSAGAEVKLSYDLWYLRHRSLLVDVAICLRTLARLTVGAR